MAIAAPGYSGPWIQWTLAIVALGYTGPEPTKSMTMISMTAHP